MVGQAPERTGGSAMHYSQGSTSERCKKDDSSCEDELRQELRDLRAAVLVQSHGINRLAMLVNQLAMAAATDAESPYDRAKRRDIADRALVLGEFYAPPGLEEAPQ
jgi:hypothetical protein